MSKMIAKMLVTKVNQLRDESQESKPVTMEELEFMPVTDKPFNPDGESDDNSFARWTPSGELKMSITNPALFGQIKEGQKYYLEFTQAEN